MESWGLKLVDYLVDYIKLKGAIMALGIGTALMHTATLLNTIIGGNQVNTKELSNRVGLLSTNGNITKLLSKYVVEPIIISTHNVRDIDNSLYDKLTQLSTDIFASFYMQAFKIMTEHMGVSVAQSVSLLGTSSSTLAMEDQSLVKEVNYIKAILSNEQYLTVSMEAKKGVELKPGYGNSEAFEKQNLYSLLTRELEITINVDNKGNKHIITIPIIIKANNVVTNVNSIINILEPNSKDKTFSARLDDYRAGAISLSELIFCGDLIKKYKENAIKDKDGLLEIINERQLASTTKAGSGLFNGGKIARGFEANYNMLIVSNEDKIRIDKHMGGDITKEAIKQKFLSQASALSYMLVDQDYERVTTFVKDIRGSSNANFNTIKKRNDKNNSGLEEIFKSMFMSKPIGF